MLPVERMPNLDTGGIRRIAVMPFETIANNAVSREMARYITAAAISHIQALNHFTLVDYTVIEQLRHRNENIEAYVDALFTGRVTGVHVNDSVNVRQELDRSNGQTHDVTTYHREVAIDFNYYITRARDGSLIGPVIRRGQESSSSDTLGDLIDGAVLLRSAVDDQLRFIGQDLVPYTIFESRRLTKEPDRNLRPLMQEAQQQARAGNYRIALASYLDIYEKYHSIAAAQNAAMLHEALGNTQAAANFLQTVLNTTGNPHVRNELARLNRILGDQARIAGEYRDTPIERVSAHAGNEIRSVLPPNARVWIYNNTANNSIVTAIVDNITADFIRRGIGIVDRQSTTLIEAELVFQNSGYVNDYDFVRIGNAAGANTIIVIGIAGTGDMRRLQLRVLDIERGIPVLQSDTNEVWRL